MNIAIIGGTSFIGHNLINYLSKKKVKIIATYNSRKKNKNTSNTFWKKLDIRKKQKNYFKYLDSPDVVVNLAWPDIPKYKLKKHYKTSHFQKRFNFNLVNNGLKNLIILGTCYEYGKVNGLINENHIAKPTIPYAISKLKLLNSIQNLKRKKDFKFAWLRPFFVYGNNKKRDTLYTLIKKLDQKDSTNINVCGSLIRDFLSVNFLCKTIAKIIFLNQDIGILNVSSGKGISLRNFIIKHIKNKKDLIKVNMNAKNPNNFEPRSFWGDNYKLKKYLSGFSAIDTAN